MNFGFGGEFRSYSFGFFHADDVPNSLEAVNCPYFECILVMLQNDPDSTGNIFFGSDRLGDVGAGIVLEPGDVSGIIPVKNLNLIWHKETDATTYLNYFILATQVIESHEHLLLEDRSHLLTEAGELLLL